MTTETMTGKTAKRLTFGTRILFTNTWGQTGQFATVIRQDGDTVTIDYLGCQHEIAAGSITAVL